MTALQRRVLPLVEARADFEISLEELRDADRGAADADLDELERAAHRIAVAENMAVFHGWKGAITGITEASPHAPVPLGASPQEYPSAVAAALERLLGSGVAGPYALALGAEQHRLVIETAEHGGYPMLEHLRKILDGPIVWAPGVREPSSSASAAATSCSTAGRTCRSATTPTTSRSCACICRRASASRPPARMRPSRSSATRADDRQRQPVGLSTSSSVSASSMSPASAAASGSASRSAYTPKHAPLADRSSCRSHTAWRSASGTTG